MSYIDTLIENCKAAKETQPSKLIEIDPMTELSELDEVKTGIYIIEDESGNPDETPPASE